MPSLRAVGDNGEPKKRGPKSGLGFDPWSTTDGIEYSLDKFYTRSTNDHDHSARQEVRIPMYLQGELRALVDSKRIPAYRSVADVFRDAVVHRLRYLGPEYVSVELMALVDEEMRLARTEKRREKLERLARVVESHRRNLEEAHARGATALLADEIDDIDDDVPTLPSPWKEELRELARDYRKKLKVMQQNQRGDEDDE